MQSMKTRKDMAEFLAQLSWADFPLAVERPAAGGFIISGGGEGRALGRYAYNEADIAEEAGRLARIIAQLNAIAAAGNRPLQVSEAEAAQFQRAVRRAWGPKLPSKAKIGAKDGIYAAAKLPRWSIAIDGPKIRPASVLDRAVRLGLSDKLARALLGRIIKAGIMPLALVTYGKTDYDLRYRADFARLKKFLQMPPAELKTLLSPPERTGAETREAAAGTASEKEGEAIFSAGRPIVRTPPPAEKAETAAKQSGERKPGGSAAGFGGEPLAAAGNAAASGSESGGAYKQEGTQSGEAASGRQINTQNNAPGRGGGRESGYNCGGRKEPGAKADYGDQSGQNSGFGGLRDGDKHQPPLAPPPRPAGSGLVTPYPPEPKAGGSPAADEDSDTEIFAEPPAHTLGTLKHKAVADKLRRGLILISPFTKARAYKFSAPLRLSLGEKFAGGQFNDDEIRYVNRVFSELQTADSILVEYNLPAIQGIFPQAKQIDIVAYYSAAKTLKIIDWKFGCIPVGIDNNPQLNGYVQRLLHDFTQGDNSSVEWIEISIVQPNSHVGVITKNFLNKNGYLAS